MFEPVKLSGSVYKKRLNTKVILLVEVLIRIFFWA